MLLHFPAILAPVHTTLFVLVRFSGWVGETNQNAATRVMWEHSHQWLARCALECFLLLDWSENYNETPRSAQGLGKVSRHLATNPSHLVQNRAVLQQLGLMEVRSHSHRKQTTPEFTGKCTEPTFSRISRHVCLLCFWCAPECDWHIHTCPNEPHQEGKQTGLWFNLNEVGMTAPWERFSSLQTADQEKPVWHYCREVGQRGFFIHPINHLRHILKTLMLFKGSVCGIKWHSGVKIACCTLLSEQSRKSKGDMKVQRLSHVRCSRFQRWNEGWGRFKSKR